MNDLVALLQDFYRDKLTELLRHQAGARLVRPYDLNNTYQYFINRDDVHLSWVGTALADLGTTAPQDVTAPEIVATGKDSDAWRSIVQEDARSAQAFVDRWRPRVETMSNARHRGMLRVILGEALEEKRSFEQALGGQLDLLGTRTAGVGARVGTVLPDRWIE